MSHINVNFDTSQIETELEYGGPINIGDELTCRLIVTGITRTSVETTGYNTGTQVLEGLAAITLTVADPKRA